MADNKGYRIADACRVTGLSRSTIMNKIKSGEIQAVKVRVPWGKDYREEYRLPPDVLQEYINRGNPKNEANDLPAMLLTLILDELRQIRIELAKLNERVGGLKSDN